MKKQRSMQRPSPRPRACLRFAKLTLEPLESRRLLTVYTVTTELDFGAGSLRDAIEQANSNPGPDTIDFNIPGAGLHTITPISQLPAITSPVFIDGQSQPGWAGEPVIELNGVDAGAANGLEFQVGLNIVQGLDIHSFSLDGIVFAEPSGASAIGTNQVSGCYIGTDPSGIVAEGNEEGIHLIHSPDTTISDNVISGNQQSGIFVADQFCAGTKIIGNYIGTDPYGLTPVPNKINGVALGAPPSPAPGDGYASGITVGGPAVSDTNYISGNGQAGIWIRGGTGNVVQGNYIGVASDGTTPWGNGAIANPSLAAFGTDGIYIDGATNTTIGGTDAGTGNIISGNVGSGIQITDDASETLVERNLIGLDLTGTVAVPNKDSGININNASDNTIGGTGTVRNLISGNARNGIEITGSTAVGNQVLGNYIGTDKSGLVPQPNSLDGVDIFNSPLNVIGGTTIAARNLISGNTGNGLVIAGSGATENTVEGNYIGTDVTGLAFCSNGGDGVLVTPLTDPTVGMGGGVGNIIGGTALGAANVISGNVRNGVEITGSSTTGNQVLGNFVGTDATGLVALPNGYDGVDIFASSLNTIGGTTIAARNLISGNAGNGLVIAGSTATGNMVEGNYIGTKITGEEQCANGGDGILIVPLTGSQVGTGGAVGNFIGGTAMGAENVISGNARNGVEIQGATSTGNQVLGNMIGTDATGTRLLSNQFDGVDIFDSPLNIIGGTTAAARNVISGNAGNGVVIAGSNATGNMVEGDYIGTTADGLSQCINGANGVLITSLIGSSVGTGPAFGNTIGGTVAGAGDIISGNVANGVKMAASTYGNVVAGDTIGLNITRVAQLQNGVSGILISGAFNNIIGGSTPLARNVISGNSESGIEILGASAVGNQIQNNYIGTDGSGLLSRPNGTDGVDIFDAPSNIVGGATAALGNLISGNTQNGVFIAGSSATSNIVEGNSIGTDTTGLSPCANGNDGVLVSAVTDPSVSAGAADQNIIGGSTLAADNLISGNRNNGIEFNSNSTGNLVENNLIGTDVTGAAKLANLGDGVFIAGGASGNTIGGAGDANTISGNGRNGVEIQGSQTVLNFIQGNFIGTDFAGETACANGFDGIDIFDAPQNLVGGAGSALRNIISGNTNNGVVIAGSHAVGNVVEGNYIGTDVTGLMAQPNGNDGVLFTALTDPTIGTGGGQGNTIGGTDPSKANLISGNLNNGVEIKGGSNNNNIYGNLIGTDNSGNAVKTLGNAHAGVVLNNVSGVNMKQNTIRDNASGIAIAGASAQQNVALANVITNNTDSALGLLLGAANNTIGGLDFTDANVLSINGKDGLYVDNQSHDNQILGNYIGTNNNGNYVAGDGNGVYGIELDGSTNTVRGNFVSGNPTGIYITGAAATENTLRNDTVTYNTGPGIDITNGASNNQIVCDDFSNDVQISHNGGAGVFVESGTGNAIHQYNIFANGGLGIDLAPAGVTQNDPPSALDADSGPNNLQNFPVLTEATIGESHHIAGSLASAANTTYTIEFFVLKAPDASGYGQGDNYVSTVVVTTNASGVANFDVPLTDDDVGTASYVSATATDPLGNTSEFSKAILIQQDSDGDGVGDQTEANGPNGGDANHDGIPDSQEDNVASFQDVVSGQYITLVAPDGTSFSNITSMPNPSPSDAPTGISFYQGFFSFTLSGLTPGASVAVQEILPPGSQPIDYYRYGPLPWDASSSGWYDWTDNGTGQFGADFNGNVITLHFVDGQYGDDDQAANGVIVDPGGPAFRTSFTVTNTNDDGPGSLRQAITDANSYQGSSAIDFNIPGSGVQTIRLLSPLGISEAVTIDGTTQPGYAGKPLIELDGEDITTFPENGIEVFSRDVTIRGLDINRFSNLGIGLYQGLTYGAYDFDIEACYIGTDPTGTIAEGNGTGIAVYGGSGTIGGALAGQGNLISGNLGDGIYVDRDYDMWIVGNLIGTAADSITPLGNAGDGVHLDLTNSEPYRAQYVTVGGLDPGDGNVIAFNQNDGIEDTSNDNYGYGYNIVSYAAYNQFLSNSIYGNTRLGISHRYSKGFLHVPLNSDSGQDLNDGASVDDGSTNPQNYPVLNSALSSGGQTTISGHLDSAPDSTYNLQFFSNQSATVTGYGQGQTYLGTLQVTTDDNGHADFDATFNVSVPNGQLVTATATAVGSGGTSDFSLRVAVGDALGNVFVVNSTDDTDDGAYNPAHVTLRDAILAANAHPGQDTIEFDIPGGGVQTIAPLTALPLITDAVIIDGTTQPGYAGTPLIQISGANVEQNDTSGAPLNLVGLFVDADDSTVRGLDINAFFSGGTQLGIGIVMQGTNDVLAGCFVGTDPTGTMAKPNTIGGLIFGTNDRIGGTSASERDIVSGNDIAGLQVDNYLPATGTSGDANLIEGNFFGTDVTGTQAIPNGGGYALSESNYSLEIGGANIVGGAAPGAGNVISGNAGNGLFVYGGAGSVIQGNFIGTDLTGTKQLGNVGAGIYLVDFTSTTDLGVTIGGTQPGDGNIISNNYASGIVDNDAFFDVIQGNFVGTDITGTLAFGNGIAQHNPGYSVSAGIIINGTDTLVGGPQPGAGNLISDNYGDGIDLFEATHPYDTNVVQGNYIGTQVDGVSPLGNSHDGVFVQTGGGAGGYVFQAPIGENVIGGLDAGEGNTIAFNGWIGVEVDGNPSVPIGILSNVIYANGSLGIDLGGDGVTPNDPLDADTGNNDQQNFPVLATVGSDGVISTVTGTYNSAPNTYYTLQFYVNATADPSGHGEGQTLLGTRYLTTDANGNAIFSFNFPIAVAPGQFVSATATSPVGDTSEFSSDVSWSTRTVAANAAPTVNVGGPYTINEGDSLTLDGSHTNDADGDPLTYTWDINGDGVFGDVTGANPTLTWTQLNALGIVNGPSTFSVTLRVDDGHGHVVTSAATTLTVLNVAPTVDAGPDQYVNEEDTVSLTGTFTDPGTFDTHMLSWHVDADNGQVISDGSGANFSFVPDDNGTYTVTFTVTDSDGGVGSAVVYVYVYDVPPVPTIVGLPAQSSVNVPINLSSVVTDVSPVDTAAGFSYYWQVYGEDNNDYFEGSDSTFSFTPTGTGTYDVYLSAQDKDGGYNYTYQTVTITGNGTTNAPPVVTLPTSQTLNEGGTYTAAGSFTDPDSTSWNATVNYGDGTGNQPLPLNADNTFALSHVYQDNGEYTVTVTVTDDGGQSGTQTTAAIVNNVAPAVTLGTPTSVAVDAVFSLLGSFTDPGNDTWIATVNYGDGTGSQPLALNADHTFDLSHVYQLAGKYNVAVTVTDDDGGVGTANVTEVVDNVQTALTVAAASATYGGTTNLSATLLAGGVPTAGKTLTFSINGQSVGTAATDSNGVATLTNVSLSALHAGSATISVSFAGDNVDATSSSTAALTIGRAPLTITADAKTMVYGAALPALTASYSGLVNNDTSASLTTAPTITTTATAASHVGSYSITATGAVDNDYVITYKAGTLSVTQAPLTITADAETKVYGAALPVLTFTPSGLVNGDTTASLTTAPTLSTTATSASHVGSYSITATGAVDNDYLITYKAGALSVTQAPLTITADAETKVYGAALPALTFTPIGLVNGDTAASLTTQPTLTTTATSASHVGSYSITATGAVDNDYTISYKAGTLSVTPAPLTITADAKTKLYGTALPALTASYSGLVNNDTAASLTTQPTLTTTATSASHVGSYSITATGAVDNDYTISYKAGTLSVTPAPLTITADAKAKLYGAALPALTFTPSGLVNGDTAASLTTQPTLTTTATSASHVGSYSITATGAVDNDYLITYKAGTLSVTQASLTITADNKTKVAGTANPALTFTPSGFVNGDTAASLTTQPTLSTTATTSSQPGTYPITVTGAVDSDYTIGYVAGTLTVTAAATGGSISGKEYLDVTGNGLTSDDTPMAGVKVYLDTNNNGVWNTGEPYATTLADGSYTFTSLAAGKYTVREVVPTGYIRTAPATTDNYSVTLATGQTASGDNFSNAQLGNTSVLCNVAYLINDTTAVADLRGATHEGDTIEVSFTVAAGTAPQRITLVSYDAPSATYSASTAAQQTIFDSDTGVFGPGTYSLSVTNPHSYFQVDFVTGAAIDHLGANGSNIFYSSQTRLIDSDNGGTHAVRTSPASLTGTVYLDANNNGSQNVGERPVSGVTVSLTCGSTTQTVVTDMYGVYRFDNLASGTYTITETQPTSYSDGKETLGNDGGTATNDKFSNVKLAAGATASGYNFGELQTVGSAVAGSQTQAASWWNGSSGQALIKALNGGQTAKSLGNWLAATFTNLFGANAGSANNLTGKTNAQVATYYQSLYANTSKKAEADALALALNMYVTNSTLAASTATSYGFAVSSSGLAIATVNVGTSGVAFGISDNTVMTIGELLARMNAVSRKGTLWDSNGDGSLNSAESVLRSQADALFASINNS